MFATLSKIFGVPKDHEINFVSLPHLTAYQRETWFSSPPVTLTEDGFDALAIFMTKNLQGRWSTRPVAGKDPMLQTIMLERESEWSVLEPFFITCGSV